MKGEDKVSKEGVTLEPTKEVVIQGEVTGIDTSGGDEGSLERAKIARAKAQNNTLSKKEVLI